MQNGTSYRQLQAEKRMTIASMRQQGQSRGAIARTLGRSVSTISRELRRNAGHEMSDYVSTTAHAMRTTRREATRAMATLDMRSVMWGVVVSLLDWRWSPQQIAATLKRMFPDESERHVPPVQLFPRLGSRMKPSFRCSQHHVLPSFIPSKKDHYASLGKCPQFAGQLPLLTPPALDNDVHI